MQHQVNLRGTKKHHDTIRDLMATSLHVFSSISHGGTQWVYGGRLFVVSAAEFDPSPPPDFLPGKRQGARVSLVSD